ncbi:IclR family transcriptional regulator [Pseudorhizobium endolithicum]|uniref:IclR family transcriptional regulator n=2 Tax=Pseudorhizobium endolithicum TaxID=1191678 RepID=A0ABN7JLF9_9HYPH|nr:IclR family transcriptional regulator [Rhizobium sp. Q54]CAD7037038.1 IclR family transcriptional regulator [Pseudorhizobium endolithicum]
MVLAHETSLLTVNTMNEHTAVSQGEAFSPAVQGTASFSKFMTVLQVIGDNPGKLDIAQLTAAVRFPRATTYRIAAGLVAEGLAMQNLDGTYSLGYRLIQLASKSWEASDIRNAARPFIEALRDAAKETVHLAVPSGNGMAYIDKLESPNAVRMMTRIGARVEFHSTSVGKAYLAALPEERSWQIIAGLELRPFTDFTFTDRDLFLEEIRKTRSRGYSYDHEENERDIRCFGSAIYDRSGEPVAGVSISIPLYRYNEDEHADYARLIQETAASITQSLAAVVK